MARYNLFLTAGLILVLPAACNKTDVASGSPELADIRFAVPIQTRATDPVPSSSVIEVRDYLTASSEYHIEDQLEASGAVWDYASGNTYKWKNGTHVLFGWLEHDQTYSTMSFFGSGFGVSGTTMTIPAMTLNTDTRQYDFLYSNSVVRSTSANDYSDVPLTLRHLFAQVAIMFEVSGGRDVEESIELNQVYLNGNYKNRKSASLDFSADGYPAITFDDEAADGYYKTPVSDFHLTGFNANSTPVDVLLQRQAPEPAYIYFWPTSSENELENVITVAYTTQGESVPRVSNLSFPSGTTWEGGHKYAYKVSYMGGILKVSETVLRWEQEPSEADVTTQSVVASWMGWDVSTCAVTEDQSTHAQTDVTFLPDAGGPAGLKKVHGMFKIYAPTACTYSVSLTGPDAAHFSLENATGTIGDGSAGTIVPGATIDFYVSAVDRPASGTYTAGLVFSVTVGDRIYSIDSELQRDGDGYHLIIPSSE